MKIAIIGSGNVGKALATSSLRAGHEVTLSASNPDHAAEAAKATGAHAAGSNADAVKEADLVIIAVPYDKLGEVFRGLGSAVDGKIVIDTTNHVDLENPGAVLSEPSNAEEIQKGTKLDGFVAGDDQAAKDKVLEFVESLGFRPIDAGPLVMARVLEHMALLNISLQIRHGWPWQNGWKLVGPPED